MSVEVEVDVAGAGVGVVTAGVEGVGVLVDPVFAPGATEGVVAAAIDPPSRTKIRGTPAKGLVPFFVIYFPSVGSSSKNPISFL